MLGDNWISPDGKVYASEYTHADTASKILGISHHVAMDRLFDKGWVRQSGDTFEIRRMSNSNHSLITHLVRSVAKDHAGSLVYVAVQVMPDDEDYDFRAPGGPFFRIPITMNGRPDFRELDARWLKARREHGRYAP
jgi:hypothetical protein